MRGHTKFNGVALFLYCGSVIPIIRDIDIDIVIFSYGPQIRTGKSLFYVPMLIIIAKPNVPLRAILWRNVAILMCKFTQSTLVKRYSTKLQESLSHKPAIYVYLTFKLILNAISPVSWLENEYAYNYDFKFFRATCTQHCNSALHIDCNIARKGTSGLALKRRISLPVQSVPLVFPLWTTINRRNVRDFFSISQSKGFHRGFVINVCFGCRFCISNLVEIFFFDTFTHSYKLKCCRSF